MKTHNFKIVLIGLMSLLLVSVSHAKCYPGLDCPEDLPDYNKSNTPSEPTQQPIPNKPSNPEPELTPQATDSTIPIVGRAESSPPPESSSEPESTNIKHSKAAEMESINGACLFNSKFCK